MNSGEVAIMHDHAMCSIQNSTIPVDQVINYKLLQYNLTTQAEQVPGGASMKAATAV
jgi:hypothetical protein